MKKLKDKKNLNFYSNYYKIIKIYKKKYDKKNKR